MWLMGGLKPDHKTVANFRKDIKEALKKVIKQGARLCIKLGLIEGNTLFVDGRKIRGNASIKNTWTQEKGERYLKDIDQRIEFILAACEHVDKGEENQQSLVTLREDIKDKEGLKTGVRQILEELEREGKKSTNITDPECTRINSIQGSHAGYSAQLVVDEKHSFVVQSDVVSENNDLN